MSSSKRMTTLQQEEDFRAVVRESLMTSIGDLLGQDAMEALVSYVPPELLVTSPQDFHSKLAGILHSGAEILEYLIVKDLAERLGIQAPNEHSVNLAEFVERGRDAALDGHTEAQESR